VLEVDDVVRFDLLFVGVLVALAVLDKLPEALALVLVDDRGPFLVSQLNRGTVLDIFPPRLSFLGLSLLGDRRVQVNHRVVVDEVHEAVSTHVVNQKLVVEENGVSVVLVAAVGVDLPDHLRGRHGVHFDHEGPFPSICCSLETTHIAVGFDVPEDGFCSIEYVLAELEVEVAVKAFDFSLGLLLERVTVGRSR
jgi:hypothetical protein